jgi:signal transduction histidine kinase
MPTELLDKRLAKARQQVSILEQMIEDKTRSLFFRTQELEAWQHQLEARVHERTQELEEANRRLIEAQEQLLRKEKLAAIGQLAGGVAHDLRNPLGAIKNAVFYLNRKLDGTEVVQSNPRIGQFMQVMHEEVEHCNQIITDLLNFARSTPLSVAPTDLAQVIEKTLQSLSIPENVQIVKQFGPNLAEVPCDGAQLQRVFTNLISNAMDAMSNGGQLTIRTQRGLDAAEVVFSDTGSGISAEAMKKLFDPLFTTKTKGTGLGLAICQQIVSKHQGSIRVASSPGAGATFTIRLPLTGTQEPTGNGEDSNARPTAQNLSSR